MEPIELCATGHPIGCNRHEAECGFPPCTTGCTSGDEIAHAALIPSGPRAGQVLVWTRCDKPSENTYFETYFWDPVSQQVTGSAPFPAGAADAFCAGHTWVLDADGKAKLFTVGGSFTNRAYWFDAETSSWSQGADPVDLPPGDTNYYPSIVTYGDDATKSTVVAVIGGTMGAADQICDPDLFKKWWSLPSPFTTGSWTTHTTSNGWYQYPRALLTSQRFLFSPGHVVTCEDEIPDPYTTLNWGGNPAQLIDLTAGTHQDLPNVDPNVVFSGGFPMGPHQPLRGWNYDNAVILHTLRPNWTWTTDPVAALGQYDLDRVFAFGGVPKLEPEGHAYDGHSVTLELQGAGTQSPSQWTWREKARASIGRATGNWLLLPTGEVLAVGGALRINVPLATTEQFDPEGPTQDGLWRPMHTRPVPSGQPTFVQRVYHSVALLLPGGEVALMGGSMIGTQPNSMHTLEIFRPPYLYYTARPSLTSVPGAIHYAEGADTGVFSVQTNALQVSKATLVGVSSATHHFDYGQRYVEMMVRQVPDESGTIEIIPPPKSSIAPPGYYMLFLVDGLGLPSSGAFVKLDYLRP